MPVVTCEHGQFLDGQAQPSERPVEVGDGTETRRLQWPGQPRRRRLGLGGGPASERKPAISGCLARSGWCRGAPFARVLVPAQVVWNRLQGRAIFLVGDGQWPVIFVPGRRQ